MAKIEWLHPELGIFAIYDENGTSGGMYDPLAPRNAPMVSPQLHLDKIYMHTDLDPMEVAYGPTTVTVNHASVASASGPSGEVGLNRNLYFPNDAANQYTLLNFSDMGYVPDFLVISEGDIIYPGQPVQVLSDGRARRIVAHATTTQIILRDWSVRTTNSIPSLSRSYTVIVFKRPPGAVGDVLEHASPATGVIELMFGKFRSDRRYLQVVDGGSPYGFSFGRTIGLSNGAVRYVDPDGSISEPVPSDLAMKVIFIPEEPNTAAFGPAMGYDGSFAGSPSVLVQVP